jgi:hypothetical protein
MTKQDKLQRGTRLAARYYWENATAICGND